MKRNGIYNTDLLEQKLELAQEKKQFLNEKFKIRDQITIEEYNLLDSSKFLKFERNLSGISALVMCGLYALSPNNPVGIFALGISMMFGVLTALATGIDLYNNITVIAELKKLKESPEYHALQQGQEKDKLLIAEKIETKQLPYPEPSHSDNE